MKWCDARSQYADRWLLIEAIFAHSQDGHRIIDGLSVVSDFDDSRIAVRAYLDFHRKDRRREFYVVHTSREQLTIEERRQISPRWIEPPQMRVP